MGIECKGQQPNEAHEAAQYPDPGAPLHWQVGTARPQDHGADPETITKPVKHPLNTV
jgi:hypothetical protein